MNDKQRYLANAARYMAQLKESESQESRGSQESKRL